MFQMTSQLSKQGKSNFALYMSVSNFISLRHWSSANQSLFRSNNTISPSYIPFQFLSRIQVNCMSSIHKPSSSFLTMYCPSSHFVFTANELIVPFSLKRHCSGISISLMYLCHALNFIGRILVIINY